MKRIFVFAISISCFLSLGCNRQLSKRGNVANGQDSINTIDRTNNSDPDGIIGNASTYGTGTGVSGQTPSGIGNGEGNTGRSGVGIKKELE